jgi:hypothetical protein
MKLEKEAKDYVNSKQDHFEEILLYEIHKLKVHISKSLWDSPELTKAKDCLTEASLWAKECAKRHGIK